MWLARKFVDGKRKLWEKKVVKSPAANRVGLPPNPSRCIASVTNKQTTLPHRKKSKQIKKCIILQKKSLLLLIQPFLIQFSALLYMAIVVKKIISAFPRSRKNNFLPRHHLVTVHQTDMNKLCYNCCPPL